MKRANILRCGLLMTEVIWLTGCASTSKQAGVEQPEGQPSVVFDQAIAKTQQAAVDALAVIGCKIKKQEPTYVEGHRRNKMGLFVGSGGETVKVLLEALEPQKTGVKVTTEKSFVGMAGQKNWDKEVLDEMTKVLNK